MQRFKSILLVLDESHLTGPATVRALELARTNRARLSVIDVIHFNPLGRSFRKFSDKMEQVRGNLLNARRQELEKLLAAHRSYVTIEIEVMSGKPFLEIIRYAQHRKCDLLIKPVEETKRFSSLLFGSTDLNLLRKCPCPVWLVKTDKPAGNKKILAAVELEAFEEEQILDQLNQQIIEIASALAMRESAELHVVNAWMIFDGEQLAKKLSKHYEEDVAAWVEEQKKSISAAQLVFQQRVRKYLSGKGMAELSCTFHFLEGEAEEVIVDLAETLQVDLAVMGTVARTHLAGLLMGNTSEAILSRINCSVLAVKPPGFISPVTVADR